MQIKLWSILSRPMKPDETAPLAREDVAFAREQGAWAFLPSMLPDRQASSKCCCYTNPLYREAFHYGFMQAAMEHVQELMFDIARQLRQPFMQEMRWYGHVEIPARKDAV